MKRERFKKERRNIVSIYSFAFWNWRKITKSEFEFCLICIWVTLITCEIKMVLEEESIKANFSWRPASASLPFYFLLKLGSFFIFDL